MASITVNPSQSFPEGTVVGVYARAANPGGAPVGAQVTSATVTAGALAFTGLVLNTLYTAYALVGSQHRYVDFAVREADVATRRQVQAGITLVEVSVDLPSVNANATADVNVAVPAGTCTAGDLVVGAFLPALNHGLFVQGAGCVATDSIRLRVSNVTAGALDAAAVSVTFAILKV